jgi:2-keto-4-pentenoate hydratase/2-oxohepta-3-ene-1,7-dioic acid hydratase in catechol pathway
MKVLRYSYKDFISYGVKVDDVVKKLNGSPFDEITYSGEETSYSGIKLLAPVKPEKIIAVGLNYMSHVLELKMDIPHVPVIFLKPPSSVINPFDKIVRPKQSKQVDYEAELAVIINKDCRNVLKSRVKDYIFGYTCLNDVTARDLQLIDSQWTRAKGFDTFCPIGPWIETEGGWKNKRIYAQLNEKIVQDSNTNDFINSVESLISYISSIMTLKQGDVISTGTAGGIGPMVDGDVIKVTIDGIGTLENSVID